MLRVLRHQVYRRLFCAQILALIGSGLATVALGLVAYDLAGADAGTVLGTALAIKMVAYVLAPLASAALARLPSRRVMVGSDMVRFAAAMSLPFVDQVWQIYLLIFVLQAASATFTPTFHAVIPQILTRDEDYTNALSLSRLAYDLESVFAPFLAAVLLLVVSSETLFLGTAAGFVASAALVVSVALPRQVSDDAAEHTSFPARVTRGMRVFLAARPLRALMALHLVVASAGAFVLVQTYVIVQDVFGAGEGTVALALGANGLGSMLAALALPRALRRVPERRIMLPATVLLIGPLLAFPLVTNAPPGVALVVLCGLWVVMGVGWSAVETPAGRLIRGHVEPADLRAAFAAQFSLSHACWLVTYPLAGWLGSSGHLTRASWTLAAIAGFAAITAVVIWRGDREPTTPGQDEIDAATTTSR